MKTLTKYITERFTSKNMKCSLFANEHVIFVPQSPTSLYMKKHYADKMITLFEVYIFLIKKTEVKKVLANLPNNKIYNGMSSNNFDLVIFKIPDNISSEQELIHELKMTNEELDPGMSKINVHIKPNDNLLEYISNIDKL